MPLLLLFRLDLVAHKFYLPHDIREDAAILKFLDAFFPMLCLPVPLPDLFLIVSGVMFQVTDILLCQPNALLASSKSLANRSLFNNNHHIENIS